MLQNREGLTDYQRVIDTQRFLAEQADFHTATSSKVVLSLVARYKALGGGWQIRTGKEFISEENERPHRLGRPADTASARAVCPRRVT